MMYYSLLVDTHRVNGIILPSTHVLPTSIPRWALPLWYRCHLLSAIALL